MKNISYWLIPGIPVEAKEYTPQEVIDLVCDSFSLPRNRFEIKTRDKDLVEVRQTVMLILNKFMRIPLNKVGRIVGEPYRTFDHATVINGIRKCIERYECYEDYRVRVDELLGRINKNYPSLMERIIGKKKVVEPVPVTIKTAKEVKRILPTFERVN